MLSSYLGFAHIENWQQLLFLIQVVSIVLVLGVAKKTRARYELCLEKLKSNLVDATTTMTTRQDLFRCLISAILPPLKEQQTGKEVDATTGEKLKKLGNKAFQEKDYETAVEQYSLALLGAGDTLRAMLNNWALCALETVALGDAIAIHRLAKALSFLGEYDLALMVIARVMPGRSNELASLKSEIQKVQHLVATFSLDNKVEDASNNKLYSALALLLQHDSVLSQIMNRLSDEKTDKPLVPLTELMLNFGMFPLLLPAHREYLPDEDIPKPSAVTVKNVLDINSHGDKEDLLFTGSMQLLPGISMMNHASEPNCAFVPTRPNKHANAVSVIGTIRPIQKGQELTMKYNTDEVVASKWGIYG